MLRNYTTMQIERASTALFDIHQMHLREFTGGNTYCPNCGYRDCFDNKCPKCHSGETQE